MKADVALNAVRQYEIIKECKQKRQGKMRVIPAFSGQVRLEGRCERRAQEAWYMEMGSYTPCYP